MKVYLIPGVGADSRLFDRFRLNEHQTTVLEWKPIGDVQSLEEYARVMAEEIDESIDFAIVGVSMGGMIAIEMAKFLEPKKTILVSSAKVACEFPAKLKLPRATKIYILTWGNLLKWLSIRGKKILGLRNGPEHRTLVEMMKEAPGVQSGVR